ncbi:zinc ribbon domain-containing protein [Ruminococcaceae bacterium OttesenSCG-928-I18]|nr:zinc ribbon domain-containing protein [Ruminococcaceae bacterium OttesenSCG-928-I18]
MKEILDGLGEAAKEFCDMLPFNDPEKKYQRAQEKLKELKKREHDVYAEIGRKLYEKNGAGDFPLEVEKLHKIYDERRMAELEVTRLQEEKEARERQCTGQAYDKSCRCPSCGAFNTTEVKFCRECGERIAPEKEAVCPDCGAQNPAGTRFCGLCGKRMGEPPRQEKDPE